MQDNAVPLGLISSNWGGTCIEAWSTDDATVSCGCKPGQGALYNNMIAPYAKMRLTGVFWYQGEANVGTKKASFCEVRLGLALGRGNWVGPSLACDGHRAGTENPVAGGTARTC